MKKMLVVLLAVVFVMAFTSVAFANPDDWAGIGPTYKSGDEAALTALAPHGGYLTTTDKCEVCHSPHGAGATSYKLLVGSTSADDACDYCHGASGVITAYRVYTGGKDDLNGHEIGTFSGGVPDRTGAWSGSVAGSLGCYDCHSVHGAARVTSVSSVNGKTLSSGAILKNDPGKDDGIAADVTHFCADCHNDNLNQSGANKTSHIMTSTTTNSSGVTVAYGDSTECVGCHTSDNGTAFSWPHTSGGEALMNMTDDNDAFVTRDTMDANCLTCHLGSGVGVGVTF